MKVEEARDKYALVLERMLTIDFSYSGLSMSAWKKALLLSR